MTRRPGRWLGWLLFVVSLSIPFAGCVPATGGWEIGPLLERTPALGESSHRLRDLAPQLVHRQGELILFLCRWRTDAPIPVSLPEDASPDEIAMLDLALDAWAGAGLGVQFEKVGRVTEGIAIRFVQTGDPGPLPKGAGDTLADCRIDGFGVAPGPIDAALRTASIHLRRDQSDLVGRAVGIEADERLGAALHELGHALGFSSHVAAGDSVLRLEPEIARRMGAAVREGHWKPDPNLRALYAVASGTRVGRIGLGADHEALLDRFERLVQREEMAGPYSRVGDRGARIFYRNRRGVPVALRVLPWPISDGDSGRLEFVPNAPALWLLESSRGSPP